MFPSKLQELRKKMGITQKALSDVLGVSQQTVAQWEKGSREPSISTILSIASFFNVTTDDLLGQNCDCSFSKELEEIDKTDKREIRKFLNKLYNDTINERIIWNRFSEIYKPNPEDNVTNFNLSFVANLDQVDAKIALFYLSTDHVEYVIMPHIIANDGIDTVLPTDLNTQRLLQKLYKYLEKRIPNKKAQSLSAFIKKYLDEE